MTKKSKTSPESLIQEAEKNYEDMEYEEAIQTCQAVLKTSPNNVKALSLCANSLMEIDRDEEARVLLLKLVELEPNNPEGWDRFLQLGQLSADLEALNYFRNGVELLKQKIVLTPEEGEAKEHLRKQLANAYASISNLYMTDLCDEDEAEQEAKKHLDLCLEADPNSDSGCIALASFLKVTNKPEDSKVVLASTLSRWKPLLQLYCAKLEEDIEPDDQLFHRLPSFEEMFNAAKLLVELKVPQEAEELLSLLLELDHPDLGVEVCFVLAKHHLLQGENDPDQLHLARERFLEVLEMSEENPHDPEQVEEARHQVEQLNIQLGELTLDHNLVLDPDYESDDDN